MLKIALSIAFCTAAMLLLGQENPYPPTPAQMRLETANMRSALAKESPAAGIDFRSLGPSVMSGRVTDIEVDPADATHFYVAYASGGLWETTNNGQSFEPLFDQEASMTIGDIAVHWPTGAIWVGTGENNSSRSSYAGTGVYLSTDKGQSWEHRGLAESHHISRICIDPDNAETVFVASLGPLYSAGGQRGIYKTTNAGETWQQVLTHPKAGAVDLVLHPTNGYIAWAALWERDRRAWNFQESGHGSGIYKTTDGGQHWEHVSNKGSGFPQGDGVGRIGLAICTSQPNILYAVLDNQARRAADESTEAGLTKDDFRNIAKKEFLALANAELETFLRNNHFPKKHTAETVKAQVESGELKPTALLDCLEDANRELFDTPVIGAELYRSSDGGMSWQRTHEAPIDELVYSYGYYFGQVRVAANAPYAVWLAGVPLIASQNSGRTFSSVNGANVHADHHALWVNPANPKHLINGNDGGINISYDGGKNWVKCNTPAVGQFYTVQVDDATPYNVYGGLQDNGVWKGPSTYKASNSWHQSGHYPYKMLLGGDGFQVMVDPRDGTTYTGSQFGYYYRLEEGKAPALIRPHHELGERPLRFNWQTPIHLSVHSPEILYLGSNKFHRSMNRGAAYNLTSPDLTQGGRKGDVPYGTISTIHESPVRFGLVYVGTDDGLVHISKDAGQTWTDISAGLPNNLWVSRVIASAHDEATVYATLNGYRWDYFDAHVYKSSDYGQTWQRICTNLPPEPVNVLREDPENPQLLYIGTDHGLYASLDGGKSCFNLTNNMPAAPVHDLAIQQREHELVVATHGRSLYAANVQHLQALSPEIMQMSLHVFEPAPLTHSSSWGETWNKWLEADEPEAQVACFIQYPGSIEVVVTTENGLELHRETQLSARGLRYLSWKLEVPETVRAAYKQALETTASTNETPRFEKAGNGKWYVVPGTYHVTISASGNSQTIDLKIEPANSK